MMSPDVNDPYLTSFVESRFIDVARANFEIFLSRLWLARIPLTRSCKSRAIDYLTDLKWKWNIAASCALKTKRVRREYAEIGYEISVPRLELVSRIIERDIRVKFSLRKNGYFDEIKGNFIRLIHAESCRDLRLNGRKLKKIIRESDNFSFSYICSSISNICIPWNARIVYYSI